MKTATITVEKAAYGEGFTATDGKVVDEYVFQLAYPLEGCTTGYAYGKSGAKLVEQAKEGPVEVLYEKKSNQYKGEFVKLVLPRADGGARNGSGPSGERKFEASPQTIAFNLTNTVFATGADIKDVLECYKYILDQLS